MNGQTLIKTIIVTCAVLLFGIIAIPRSVFNLIDTSPATKTGDATTTTKVPNITSPSTIVADSSSFINAADADGDDVDTTAGSTFIYADNSLNTISDSSKVHTKPQSPKSPTPQPTNNSVPASSSSQSSSTSSSSVAGSSSWTGFVLAAVVSNLSVTGSYWFFIALIGNILMMLLGGYLRLRSGRSPGYVYAV